MARVFVSMLMALALGLSALVHAQADGRRATPFAFESLNGLSHNTVYSLLQDRQDYLWVGTATGIVKVAIN